MINKMNVLMIAECRLSVVCQLNTLLAMVLMLLLLAVLPAYADEQTRSNEIGQVTLVIGKAVARDKNGNLRSLKRGDSIYVDEFIETYAGGHVHLRFIDEATLSLRPNSRLGIELYHYDQLHPKNSAIRFNLETGVVRSISGKATQAAHERFRLNTPITAIGVLGTDFVVRAESERIWAGVYSGAIAIAPLGGQCSVDGLGACSGATRLSEAMGSVMIEFSGNKGRERIIPLDPAILSKATRSDSNSSAQTNANNSSSQVVSGSNINSSVSASSSPVREAHSSPSDTVTGSGGAPAVSAPGRLNPAEVNGTDVATRLDVAQQTVHAEPDQLGRSGQVQQAELGSPMPSNSQPIPRTLPPAPFAWARWGTQWAGDEMSSTYLDAKAGRKVTVGNRYYALFRSSFAASELEPRAGVYDFRLTQGQVHFVQADHVSSLAQLDAATLRVDFAQRQFDTHLEMSHPQAGSAAIDLTGAIRDNGLFSAQDLNSRVAGALSSDGGYAGMLFERQVETGAFQGITDWAR